MQRTLLIWYRRARHLCDATASRLAAEAAQTSAEYALVLFGAASVAMLVALWARNTDQVGELLDAVFGNLVKMVR